MEPPHVVAGPWRRVELGGGRDGRAAAETAGRPAAGAERVVVATAANASASPMMRMSDP